MMDKSTALLERRGYRCTRCEGSLGLWDIVGIGPRDVILALVRGAKPSSEEMRKLWMFAIPLNVQKTLHIWEHQLSSDYQCWEVIVG